MSRNPFLESLDRDNDEDGVRARLASPHGYQESHKLLVREWLRERDDARASASALAKHALEEEAISVAREANEIARSASFAASAAASAAVDANALARRSSRIAIIAIVIAAIAAVATIAQAIGAFMGVK